MFAGRSEDGEQEVGVDHELTMIWAPTAKAPHEVWKAILSWLEDTNPLSAELPLVTTNVWSEAKASIYSPGVQAKIMVNELNTVMRGGKTVFKTIDVFGASGVNKVDRVEAQRIQLDELEAKKNGNQNDSWATAQIGAEELLVKQIAEIEGLEGVAKEQAKKERELFKKLWYLD